MNARPVHTLPRGVVHVARAESVYPTIEPGSVSLVISDGPYGMVKAAWDRQKGPDGLREWYRPHVEAWGRVCAPAASVYLWGTQRSVRALQPLMEAEGWTWRTCVVWDKTTTPAIIGARNLTTWADSTEACDVWTRGSTGRSKEFASMNVWRLPETAYRGERLYAEDAVKHKYRPGAFNRQSIHPCQKPLTFYDRIIRASSRPGDLVLEPFGGTLRAAAACEAMPESEARRYVCVEPDEDGRGYVPAALAAIRADLDAGRRAPSLWEPPRPETTHG